MSRRHGARSPCGSLDLDGDGKLTRQELDQGFALADVDGNGKLSRAEQGRSATRNRGRRTATRAPQKGEVAPAFTLKTLDGKKTESLATYKGKKPVALIFGSYT